GDPRTPRRSLGELARRPAMVRELPSSPRAAPPRRERGHARARALATRVLGEHRPQRLVDLVLVEERAPEAVVRSVLRLRRDHLLDRGEESRTAALRIELHARPARELDVRLRPAEGMRVVR